MTVVKDDHVQIDRLELGPFGTNCYFLTCQKTGKCVVVDAPGDANRMLERLSQFQPQYILITHNHFDHIGALSQLKSSLGIAVAAHPADVDGLPVPVDILLNDDDEISFGAVRIKALHTPGHTPGSLCFLAGSYLIAGDTLFPGGPGRTRTPADFRQIIKSITRKIFELPEDTGVYPGHGEATSIKQAKELFEVFSSKAHDPDLCGDVEWL